MEDRLTKQKKLNTVSFGAEKNKHFVEANKMPDGKKFLLFSERLKLAEEYEEWVKKPLEDGSKIKDCALSVITFMQIKGLCKIPEGAVVLTEKEYKRYERIEKIIKLAKREKANGYEVRNGKLYYFSNMLDGFEYEFKDLQEICDAANHYNEEFWALDQRLAFWQGKAEETRKETAEKFAERVKMAFYYEFDELIPSIMADKIDEICKEITEGKANASKKKF